MTIGLAATTWTKVFIAPLMTAFACFRPASQARRQPLAKPFPFFGE